MHVFSPSISLLKTNFYPVVLPSTPCGRRKDYSTQPQNWVICTVWGYLYVSCSYAKLFGLLEWGIWCRFSTSLNSVHGERPSAEYAKQRKQSLEEEFGHVLGTYSSRSVSVVYRFGPFLALFRAAVISYYVLKLSVWQLFVDDIHKRATKVSCGPFSFLIFFLSSWELWTCVISTISLWNTNGMPLVPLML